MTDYPPRFFNISGPQTTLTTEGETINIGYLEDLVVRNLTIISRWLATLPDGQTLEVAIKELDSDLADPDDPEIYTAIEYRKLIEEMSNYLMLLTEFLDCQDIFPKFYLWKKEDTSFYLVLELMGQNLEDEMENPNRLIPLSFTQLIHRITTIVEIGYILSIAHKNGLAVGDVKPSNICRIISDENKGIPHSIKFIDLSALRLPNETDREMILTLKYAPESAEHAPEGFDARLLDTFASVVIACEFICGRHPSALSGILGIHFGFDQDEIQNLINLQPNLLKLIQEAQLAQVEQGSMDESEIAEMLANFFFFWLDDQLFFSDHLNSSIEEFIGDFAAQLSLEIDFDAQPWQVIWPESILTHDQRMKRQEQFEFVIKFVVIFSLLVAIFAPIGHQHNELPNFIERNQASIDINWDIALQGIAQKEGEVLTLFGKNHELSITHQQQQPLPVLIFEPDAVCKYEVKSYEPSVEGQMTFFYQQDLTESCSFELEKLIGGLNDETPQREFAITVWSLDEINNSQEGEVFVIKVLIGKNQDGSFWWNYVSLDSVYSQLRYHING